MVSKRELTKFLGELGFAELKELKVSVDQRLGELESEAREQAREKLREQATQLGFDLGELFPVTVGRGRAASGGSRSAGQRASPEPKYRDPKTGDTWSGRGREPRWMTAALAEGRGKSKDDFLIK